ncbi:hypothetical protein HBI67_026550 [Parastagonospora nodorum]|nr:hypothetical protein HBI66_071020 [Parastagonospora nodorum]KAH6083674.1 hypothetical protein HBI67_026550 [Parastagonospora nodorum]
MGVGMKVLMGIRVIALISTLIVVGLGAWSRFVEQDIETRGAAVLQRLQPEALTAQEWRDFFIAATQGTSRIWITIVAASIAFLTSFFVVLSSVVRGLKIPGTIRVPVEFLSMSAMIAAFGCSLSLAWTLLAFTTEELETADSADLTMFTMILPLSRGLVVTTGCTSFILLSTSITALVRACMGVRDKESCSFEPTASALGMGHGYQAIVPPAPRSRPPTLYDPRKPLPKQLDGMPQTEEERALAQEIARTPRTVSVLSESSRYSGDFEKEETWPLNPEKTQVRSIRPSRPWSGMPKNAKSPGFNAM